MNKDYVFYGPYDMTRNIMLKFELGKEVMKDGNLCGFNTC